MKRWLSLRGRFVVYLVGLHLLFAALAIRTFYLEPWWLLGSESVFLLTFSLGFVLLRSLDAPLERLRGASHLLRENELTTRLVPPGQPELDALVGVYNRLVDDLREQRTRLEEQHYFLAKVLDASPSGILTLDFSGRIVLVNPAAERILDLERATLLGCQLEALPGEVGSALAALKDGASRVLTLRGRRRVRGHRSHILDRGFARPFLVLEELTEELRRNEKTAYERLVRMMAHEIGNSVGASNSLLQSCLTYADQLRAEDRDDFAAAVGLAISRADHLHLFVQSFADVLRLGPPKKEPVDLAALLNDVVRLHRPGWEQRQIRSELQIENDLPLVALDRPQFEQALVNILKNAAEAAEAEPGIARIAIRLENKRGRPWLAVEDSGRGFAPESAAQLFTPFYSTKERGQGIGLTLVHEILTAHGFDFSLDSELGQPTRFWIAFR